MPNHNLNKINRQIIELGNFCSTDNMRWLKSVKNKVLQTDLPGTIQQKNRQCLSYHRNVSDPEGNKCKSVLVNCKIGTGLL